MKTIEKLDRILTAIGLFLFALAGGMAAAGDLRMALGAITVTAFVSILIALLAAFQKFHGQSKYRSEKDEERTLKEPLVWKNTYDNSSFV